jgi:hypothetical protein
MLRTLLVLSTFFVIGELVPLKEAFRVANLSKKSAQKEAKRKAQPSFYIDWEHHKANKR